MIAGIVSDRLGRRPAIFWGSIIGLIGVILQSVEQNVAMFVVARIILGFGTGIQGVAAGVYLANRPRQHWLEDVHGQRVMGHCYLLSYRESPAPSVLSLLISLGVLLGRDERQDARRG
jgi:MFS family permease